MTVRRERLDMLLLSRDMVPSRQKARALVLAGEVVVDDHRVDKPGTRVPVDAAIRLKRPLDGYVGRGAHKLRGALDAFEIDLQGVVALDVGASTGGFTQIMLERGAALVHAVDVGRNQLAWKLRQDERVRSREGVNFRYLDPATLDPRPEFATVDVSFIGLGHILPVLSQTLVPGGIAVVLVKPQFELGREAVGKGGIVREPALREQAVTQVSDVAERCGFRVRSRAQSPITGTDGNVEFFLCLERVPS